MSALRWALCFGLASAALASVAQQFPMFQGNPQRTGSHDADARLNNPNRGFLRWWDPLFAVGESVDNWESTNTSRVGGWTQPNDIIEAFGFLDKDPNAIPRNPSYLYAPLTPQRPGGNPWDPQNAADLRSFTWRFDTVNPGEEYALYVYIPAGPTDVDAGPNLNLLYPARYQVYRIDGVENIDNPGQPIYQVIDTFQYGGGRVRLGANGAATSQVFTVDSASSNIEITVFNIAVRDEFGQLIEDPLANFVIYADGAEIARQEGAIGRYAASAVVGRLASATDPFPWRVFGARLEDSTFVDNNTAKSYSFPVISAFTHNSALVNPPDNFGRRNLIWSWPALRPIDPNQADVNRYNVEREQWLLGEGKYPGPRRFDQVWVQDNRNGNVAPGAAFSLDNTLGNVHGEDAYVAPALGGTGTSAVIFSPRLMPARYAVDLYVPPGASTATNVPVEIQVGSNVFPVRVDMNTGGWIRLVSGTRSVYDVAPGTDLSVRVANGGTGGDVIADAIRVTRVADLSVTSTPVFARVGIRQPDNSVVDTDVVVVAMNNGKIYCLDATGFVGGGGIPTGDTRVYWVYPSERANDPNQVVGQDGPDGMAEMPTSFNLSSAVVARVDQGGGNFEDTLFVGGANGRVYSIDMAGRGDFGAATSGTTRRNWTFPNDYPSPSIASQLGPIVGSVSFANTADGPTLFVPTVQGRLYALDAVGNAIQKTTTRRWAYPSVAGTPIGPINMAPVVAFGNVYFGTGTGAFAGSNTLFAVSQVDGNSDGEGDLVWSRNTDGVSVFSAFGTSSPAAISASDLNGGPNTLVAANDNFNVAAYDATNGNVLWNTTEIGASPSASLGFTYIMSFQAGGLLRPLPGDPVVMVPTVDGRYTALYADTGTLNPNGRRAAWSVTAAANTAVPAMAFGARDTTLGPVNDDEFSWMYAGDELGYFYAWNFDPDFPEDGQAITPGIPPIPIQPDVEDTLSDRLDSLARNARMSLLLPEEFETLQRSAQAGTLSYAQVQAAAGKVTRTSFEFGETLWIMIYDLADPAASSPATPYNVQVSLTAPGSATTIRSYATTAVTGTTQSRNRVVLVPWTLTIQGRNGLAPGPVQLRVAVISQERPGANRTMDETQYLPNSPRYFMAHPLGLANRAGAPGTLADPDSIGLTLDPARQDTVGNGNDLATIVGAAVVPTGTTKVLSSIYEDATGGSFVSHGQTATDRLLLYDRSLLVLVQGPGRGISGVRTNLTDLWWGGSGPNNGVLKPLDQTLYPGLEDRPGSPGNNTSLDYPDIRRDRIRVAKEQNRGAQNPEFAGVDLVAPVYADTAFSQYRSDATQYNQFLSRTLNPTQFQFELDVPQFQPPTAGGLTGGYVAPQIFYVDSGNPGRDLFRGVGTEPFRTTSMRSVVAVDERITIGTPSINLGPMPGGSGFSPEAPWNDPSFRLDSPLFHNSTRFPYFGRTTVFNEGNVNLLNVRNAKNYEPEGSSGAVPLQLRGTPNINFLAWLDARWHLHSDLDARFVPADMPGRRVIVQKSRPGDSEPTRLRVNPRVRTNPNTGAVGGDFLPPASFPDATAFEESKLDPKIGVSIPVGAPSGQYLNDVFVFEDTDFSAAAAVFPTLNLLGTNVYEPFNQQRMQLGFTVRETRITNRQTNKSRPMMDDLGQSGTERHLWRNQQPALARSASGNVVLAFTSDRIDSGNQPGFIPRPRDEADAARTGTQRLYIASLRQGAGTTPTGDASRISELSRFDPATAGRWFSHDIPAYPNTPDAVLFGVPAATIEQNSVLYRDPAFPAAGTFEPLSALTDTGRSHRGTMFMAFVGELTHNANSGSRVREQRLMIANVNAAGAGVAVTDPVVLTLPGGEAFNPEASFGPPSLVQVGNTATVFYTMSTNSGGSLMYSVFGGGQWQELGGGFRGRSMGVALETASTFESVSSPSATIRTGNARTAIDLAFTGRVRGRNQNEVYLGTLNASTAGTPQGSFQFFPTRQQRPEGDSSSGLFWTDGARWRTTDQDFNPANPNSIDVMRLVVTGGTGTLQSILVPGTRQNAEGSAVHSWDCTLGGKVFIDMASGSIRFSGAVIPRTMTLFARYTPAFLRLTESEGFNQRSVSMIYDDRFVDDPGYLRIGAVNGGLGTRARNDRFVLGLTRTASLTGSSSRPGVMTYRFGVELPTDVLLDDQGGLITMNVTGVTGPVQIDPSGGPSRSARVFVESQNEGNLITVNYRAADETGRDLGVRTVTLRAGIIVEFPERSLDFDESANEVGLKLALDPLGGGFNNVDQSLRRPNLIWMVWTSSRGGGSDLYFQTIAPRWGAVLAGQ